MCHNYNDNNDYTITMRIEVMTTMMMMRSVKQENNKEKKSDE